MRESLAADSSMSVALPLTVSPFRSMSTIGSLQALAHAAVYEGILGGTIQLSEVDTAPEEVKRPHLDMWTHCVGAPTQWSVAVHFAAEKVEYALEFMRVENGYASGILGITIRDLFMVAISIGHYRALINLETTYGSYHEWIDERDTDVLALAFRGCDTSVIRHVLAKQRVTHGVPVESIEDSSDVEIHRALEHSILHILRHDPVRMGEDRFELIEQAASTVPEGRLVSILARAILYGIPPLQLPEDAIEYLIEHQREWLKIAFVRHSIFNSVTISAEEFRAEFGGSPDDLLEEILGMFFRRADRIPSRTMEEAFESGAIKIPARRVWALKDYLFFDKWISLTVEPEES